MFGRCMPIETLLSSSLRVLKGSRCRRKDPEDGARSAHLRHSKDQKMPLCRSFSPHALGSQRDGTTCGGLFKPQTLPWALAAQGCVT